MKVYEPRVLLHGDGNGVFTRLTFADDADRQRFAHGGNFKGHPMSGEVAQPYRVARSADRLGDFERPLGDRLRIGYWTDPMALSRRALDVLLPCIGTAAQVIPLTFAESDYALLNVLRVIDALDAEQSEILRYDDGAFRRVQRYVFRPEAVHDEWIFKIRQAHSHTFVTQRFVDVAEQAGLTGFDFEEIWSDEPAQLAAP